MLRDFDRHFIKFELYKLDKKTLLLLVAYFLATFIIYSLTLSDNLSNDSDFILIPARIEGLTTVPCRPAAHVLWFPLGKLVYKCSLFLGYTGRSVKPLEVFNILAATAGSTLFLSLILRLTGNIPVSLYLTILLFFSYPWWYQSIHTKFYSCSFFCIILCFYLYTYKNIAEKPLILGVVNALALLFHISNFFIVICTIGYLLSLPGDIRRKLLNAGMFLLDLIVFVIAGYLLAHISDPFWVNIHNFQALFDPLYNATWLNFFKYYFLTIVGIPAEYPHVHKNWPWIIWLVSYFGVFFYLFISSMKNLCKNTLFYLALNVPLIFFISAKSVSPNNHNVYVTLIAFNLIMALALADYKSFSPRKRNAICYILAVLAISMCSRNFGYFYFTKGLERDWFYQQVICRPQKAFSSEDVIVANAALSFYIEYYKKNRVYHLEEYLYSRQYDRLVENIKRDLMQGKSVKIFLDRKANYYDRVIQKIHIIESDFLLKELSRDFHLKLLYKSENGQFVMYQLTMI